MCTSGVAILLNKYGHLVVVALYSIGTLSCIYEREIYERERERKVEFLEGVGGCVERQYDEKKKGKKDISVMK